jgi:hypothetical protein
LKGLIVWIRGFVPEKSCQFSYFGCSSSMSVKHKSNQNQCKYVNYVIESRTKNSRAAKGEEIRGIRTWGLAAYGFVLGLAACGFVLGRPDAELRKELAAAGLVAGQVQAGDSRRAPMSQDNLEQSRAAGSGLACLRCVMRRWLG